MRHIAYYPFAALAAVAWLVLTVSQAGAGELDDLKAQVQQLLKRIEALEVQKAIAVKPAAGTPERAVNSGNDNVKLAISGQVNRAVLLADDGDRSKFFQVDNDNSSTRIRWVGSAQLNEDISAGALIEVQFESNSTADIDIDQEAGATTNNFTERHLTLYLDSKRLGRLWLGQGDTASNGTSEADLSGTTVVAYAGIQDLAGGLSFKNASTQAKLVTIGSAYSQLDGFSRRDRIRYDTPKFNGFQASTSFSEGDAWDAALRYSANYENIGTKVAAAIAYGDGAQRFDYEQINGSISLLHESGVNATFASGSRDLASRSGDDPTFYYGKFGYLFQPFMIGKTALAVDYGVADDLAAVGDEFATWGIFAVQNIDRISTELYIGFRNHALDRTGISVDDINVGVAGARVKF